MLMVYGWTSGTLYYNLVISSLIPTLRRLSVHPVGDPCLDETLLVSSIVNWGLKSD